MPNRLSQNDLLSHTMASHGRRRGVLAAWRTGSINGGVLMEHRFVQGRWHIGAVVGSRQTRRRFVGTTVAAGLAALTAPTFALGRIAFAAEEPAGVAPAEALKMLMEGNARY